MSSVAGVPFLENFQHELVSIRDPKTQIHSGIDCTSRNWKREHQQESWLVDSLKWTMATKCLSLNSTKTHFKSALICVPAVYEANSLWFCVRCPGWRWHDGHTRLTAVLATRLLMLHGAPLGKVPDDHIHGAEHGKSCQGKPERKKEKNHSHFSTTKQ
jgi:hypothetical protein